MLWPAVLLVPLAVVGAIRAPAFGLAALVTVALHTAIPHKEVRHIYLALACFPLFLGIGVWTLLEAVGTRTTDRLRNAGAVIALGLFALLSWTGASTGVLAARWQFNRTEIEAFAAAHRQADLCGLGVAGMRVIDSGGYTYLHRDVLLLFREFDPAISLPGAAVTLRYAVTRHGLVEPQFPGRTFSQGARQFNYLIAPRGQALDGYDAMACFTDQTRSDRPDLCLFRRVGGCSG